jgi:hypothetical protein
VKLTPLIAGLALLATVTLTSCGGGDESGPPLNVYFDSIQPFFTDTAERTATSDRQMREELAAAQSQEQRLVVFQEGVDGIASAYSSLRVQLTQVEPAGKAKDAREGLIAATVDVIDPLQVIFDATFDVQSEDDLTELLDQLDGPEVAGAQARQVEACLRLQAVAEENDLDVDLACTSD